MDFFHFHTIKSEKTTTVLFYNRLRSFAKLFRFAECFLVLGFLSWISSRLPFAVKISGEYFRSLSGIIASNLFIFLLCNIIIVILYVNSVRFTAKNFKTGNATEPALETGIYEEFLKNTTGDRISPETENMPANRDSDSEEIVYQDKEIVSEVKEEKEYRRSLSENFHREIDCKKLRRSETEICRKVEKKLIENPFPEDEMSNEEFQRTIDEFIAKQLKFRRQESSAIVVRNQS